MPPRKPRRGNRPRAARAAVQLNTIGIHIAIAAAETKHLTPCVYLFGTLNNDYTNFVHFRATLYAICRDLATAK